MYCVNCGVELADSETVCPLCGTRVFHPDLPRKQAPSPYPADPHGKPEEVNRSGILFVMTMLALLPAVICLLCDWRINGGIVWSGYAAGAIGLLYVLIVLPMWFSHPNPVVFVPVDFAAIGLYLLYIDLDEGRLVFVVCVSGHGGNRAAVNGGGGAGALCPCGVSVYLRRRAAALGRSCGSH